MGAIPSSMLSLRPARRRPPPSSLRTSDRCHWCGNLGRGITLVRWYCNGSLVQRELSAARLTVGLQVGANAHIGPQRFGYGIRAGQCASIALYWPLTGYTVQPRLENTGSTQRLTRHALCACHPPCREGKALRALCQCFLSAQTSSPFVIANQRADVLPLRHCEPVTDVTGVAISGVV